MRLARCTLEQGGSIQFEAGQGSFDPMCWMAAGARACAGMKNEKQRQRADFALSDFALNYLQPLLPGGASVDVVLQASGHAVRSAERSVGKGWVGSCRSR